MHHTVQGWIAKSLTNETVTLSPDELERVWELIERHVEIENRMAEAVKELLPQLKGKKMVVQEYLLQYLLDDEAKHANLLKRLETIKKGMLP
jgi:bacterioferritin (cytochrome b1)